MGGDKNPTKECTAKERRFCEEYIKDFNGVRAYMAAGYSGNATTAAGEAWKLRQTNRVYKYLQHLQKDIEKASGVSRMQVLKMHLDIAKTSIAQFHNTWITRTEFEKLTPEEKACIQEIDVKTKSVIRGKGKAVKTVETEYVRLRLYDRQKSLDAIAKMCGYNEPDKLTLIGDKEAIAGLFPFGK